jgi:eukaryotic-like serine/threonine-protein kinase
LAVPKGANLKALGIKDYGYVLHLAPEVHSGGTYSVLTDVYAVGVTLYRLVNGDNTLPAISPADIPQACIDGKYPDRAKYREFVPRPLRLLVNRAIDVNPTKRFQSAESMRHALEQITIQMNWHEQLLTNGVRWVSAWYEVMRVVGSDKKWNVETRKGKSKKALRKVASLCRSGLTATEAEKVSRRILQDHVLGRLK